MRLARYHLRASVILGPEETLELQEQELDALRSVAEGVVAGEARMPMAPPAAAAPPKMKGERGRAAEPEPIRVRTDFAALALFAASLPTDAEGRVSVNVKVPDNLTRYRIMAVAAEGNRLGSAESTVTARLPLIVE